MRTPGARTPPLTNDSSWRCPCVGSDRLHVAEFPSAVTAGIEKVCPVLPGMNAEYMGEKMIGTVGVEHEPGCVLTAPASTGGARLPSLAVVGLLAPPSLEVLPLEPPPPEHAAKIATTPAQAIPSANAALFRLDREFILCPDRGEKRMAHAIVRIRHEQARES